jgi:hypothetical protein
MTEIEQQDFSNHETGNENCKVCEEGYPHRCQCGGLIHAEIAEVEGSGYVELTRCEQCGMPETPA